MDVADQREKLSDTASLSPESEEISQAAVVQEESPQFDLEISADRLEATLGILNAAKVEKVCFEDVMGCLKNKKIIFGVLEESIHNFCDSGEYTKRFICAKGVPSVDGVDGSLEYKINIKKDLKPKELEDGTVDYRNLGIVENVREGEELCRLIPSAPGKDGIDVYNEVIPFLPGKTPSFPQGANTVPSEDGLRLLSRVDGCIEYKNMQINVLEVYIVHGDVNCITGNIHSLCSVIVQGDVMEGFFVKSGKDVTIRGMVEGAMIEAEGNIVISNGMIGMGHGILKAEGTVSAKYFENATIIAKGDITAENMMNCRVETDGSIKCRGRNAALIGGSYKAGRTISAKYIGNSGYTKTVVSIASKKLNEIYAMNEGSNSSEEMQSKLSKFQQAKELLQQQIEAVENIGEEESQVKTDSKRIWLKSASVKQNQINAAIQTLQQHIEQDEKNNQQLSYYEIMVSGIAYPGVSIEIGPYRMKLLQENSCTKFYGNVDRVVFAPLLQSEIDP